MDVMKQTAVEFLMGKLFDPSTMVAEQIQWFEEAKEIEKEQHRKTYHQGLNSNFQDFEQYYNETFNTNDK
jgi:hypothetical protein